MQPDSNPLSIFTDDALHEELRRRDQAERAARHERAMRAGTYFCAGCGFPDSSHAITCPTDTECD